MSKAQRPIGGNSPQDPELRAIRIRTWFKFVSGKSKKTAAALEREFSEPLPGKNAIFRSCIWQKYKQGWVEPRSASRISRKPGLVERVEKRYPGGAKWLTSLIWRLADKHRWR